MYTLQIEPDVHSSAFCDCLDVANLAEYPKLYHNPTPLTYEALSMAYSDFVLFRSKVGRFLLCYCAPFVLKASQLPACSTHCHLSKTALFTRGSLSSWFEYNRIPILYLLIPEKYLEYSSILIFKSFLFLAFALSYTSSL